MSIVSDPVLGRAVTGIVPNADKQLESELLERTFVDVGVLAQLEGPNSQILFGRRGTGKSHLLRLLTVRRNREPGDAAVFVDVRRLGSAQLMTDPDKPLTVRSVSVFRDLLAQLQSLLLDLATDPGQPERIDALESVSDLADTIAQVSSTVSAREITTEAGRSARRSGNLSAGLSASPAVSAGFSAQTENSAKVAEHYTVVVRDTIVFSEIAAAVEQALVTLGIRRLYFVLDEWSTIPPDVQPYVAEFLKRSILPSSRMILKIGSLPYRSAFSTRGPGGALVGFEFGGEVTRNINLDERYAAERDDETATTVFTDLIWRHLMANIRDDGYLRDQYAITAADDLRRLLFSDDHAFADLVRAASGVRRDFLSIFTEAYFRAAVARTDTISVAAVRHAARASFQTEKVLNLDPGQQRVLRAIAGCLGQHGGGLLFVLDSDLLADTLIQSLFDLRVIHLVERHYAGDGQPGRPLSLYALDFGAALALGLPGDSGDAAGGPGVVPDVSAIIWPPGARQ